jgi:hypothetical protein
MTPNRTDDPRTQGARDAFEAAVDDLDAATANRLRIARREALSASRSRWSAWMPVAGAALLGVLAWLLWPRAEAPAPTPRPMIVETPRQAPAREVDTTPIALPPAPEPVVVAPEEPEAVDPEVVPDDAEPAWIDEEEGELYAWLGDAPVAPDEGDAL